jgi:hypothetical protein
VGFVDSRIWFNVGIIVSVGNETMYAITSMHEWINSDGYVQYHDIPAFWVQACSQEQAIEIAQEILWVSRTTEHVYRICAVAI